MEQLVLRRKEDRRLRQGHLWVFSNEVQALPDAPPGALVEVRDAGGGSLGTALYNPHSLICARLLGGDVAELDHSFFLGRLEQALQLRRHLFPEDTCWRLVHGESDGLPGLIVDRFDRHLVLQTLTAGMDQRKETICDSLLEMLQPDAILERNDSPLRRHEDLPQQSGILRGHWPGSTEVLENGIRYRVDLLEGQKTGLFLDQKLNRRAAARYCRGRTVLDGFCNAGGFGLNALRAGALEVTGVDSSAPSLQQARHNVELNGLSPFHFRQADVFDFLAQERAAGRRYGVVILDPPSFARNRKNVPAARQAYRALNEAGLRVLEPGGFLITASCSHLINEDTFYLSVQTAAQRVGARLQLLEQRSQGPDHPVLPGMPETKYLKLGIFRCV